MNFKKIINDHIKSYKKSYTYFKMFISHKKMNPGSDMLKNIFKTLKLRRCLEFIMYSGYDFEKSYLPQKGIFFNILYV